MECVDWETVDHVGHEVGPGGWSVHLEDRVWRLKNKMYSLEVRVQSLQEGVWSLGNGV